MIRRVGLMLLLAGVLAACSGSVPTLAPAATETPPVETVPPYIALSGKIEFGADFDQDTLEIIKPAARFHATSNAIAYVAHLRGTADATELTLTFVRQSSGGAETTIFSSSIPVSNPEADTFANTYPFALLADRKLGTYVLRVIREDRVLAEGTFTLVK